MKDVLVAVLAAGVSRRMGKPKLCLPWGRITILGHIIEQWRGVGVEDLLVVHAPEARTPVSVELDRLNIPMTQRIATVAPERGMMGSVVTAARLACDSPARTHLIIALGDQPQVRMETLQMLLEGCHSKPGSILRVVHQGKAGHPLALPAKVLPGLSATSCATLRDFVGLNLATVEDLTCSDSGVLLDIDTPEDYEQASRTAAARSL